MRLEPDLPQPPALTSRLWLHLPVLAVAADLHLDPFVVTPRQEAFIAWLASLPTGLPVALLGDLFDFWIGDDWDPPAFRPLFAALAAAASKRPLFFQAGNRDFLAGRQLAQRIGWRRLPPLVGVVIGAQRFLLTHGDALCWEDRAYLAWRQQTRQPRWQRAFLTQPLANRLAFAQEARARSQARRDYPDEVSDAAVRDLFARYPRTHLIHGHTHRPRAVGYTVGDAVVMRWVLPEWHDGEPAAGRVVTAAGVC